MHVLGVGKKVMYSVALFTAIFVTTYGDEASAAVKDYNTVGNSTYTAPSNGVYTFEIWGAQGAGNSSTTGRGGYVKGTKILKVGDTVNMVIGGSGSVGSGTGKNAGGGYTKVYLNGTDATTELATAAGGGGGPSGGDGGVGNGNGGSSVGNGAGTNGTLGGGGGSSPDYSYSSGYYQDTGYYETYQTSQYEETYSSSPISGWNCGGTTSKGMWCWRYKTASRWVSTGQKWVSTGSSYTAGNPGMGGSNVNGAVKLDSYLSQNGVRTGNGMVRITTPGQAPTLNLGYDTSRWFNTDQTITVTATENMEPVEGIQGPDGVWKNGNVLNYVVKSNGTYTFNTKNVSGDTSTKSLTVSNIDTVLPNGLVVKTVNPDSTVKLVLSGVSDNASGVKEIVRPDGTVVTGVTADTFTAKADGTYTYRVIDHAGNERSISTVVTGVDIIAPMGVLTQSPLSDWVNGKVTITLSGIYDLGGSGYKETVNPDGTRTTDNSITYVVSENGTYRFEMFDNVGNKSVKTAVVSNIDTVAPNVPNLYVSSEDWSKPGVTVDVVSNGDVTGGSGINRLEYRLNGESWKTFTGNFSIPTSYVGDVKIETRAVDNVGLISGIVSKSTKIDGDVPDLSEFKIVESGGSLNLTVSASDKQSGLASNSYQFYRKEVGKDSSFVRVTDSWTDINKIELPTEPSNTKFVYKVEVRDLVGNVASSDDLTYVSPVELKFGGVKEGGNANTITLDFMSGLRASKEVMIEVTRGSNVVGRVVSGDTYKDEGLDYDRSYSYKLVASTLVGGKKVESVPLYVDYKIGSPSIEVSAISETYSTPFSDTFTLKGNSRLKTGGVLLISLWDGDQKIGDSKQKLSMYNSENWSIDSTYKISGEKQLDVLLQVEGLESLHSKRIPVLVKQKKMRVDEVKDVSRYAIFK